MGGFVLRRLEPHAGMIKQRYAEGESFEELAARFGCGWSTIRRFLISHEVPLRPAVRKRKLDAFGSEVIEAFHAGAPVGDIALRFEVQPQTVRNFLLDRAGELALIAEVPRHG